VLLLDEPLAALDLKLRRHLQVELRRLQRELGMTFVYVTHDQGEALSMSDSIVLMNSGKIVQHSPPRELYDRPVSVFAATFIGDANVMPCAVVSASGREVVVRLGGTELAATMPVHGGVDGGAQAMLCVRPEHIRLGGAEPAALRGRVTDVTFQGAVARYWVTIAGVSGELIAESAVRRGDVLHAIGNHVAISFEPNDALVLAS
jgi:ABC-type Fe3+/spermidine/putrescine transport system ATPase subunit